MESKNNWKAWLYLAPILVLLVVFTFYPIINTIGISFLKNYNTLYGTHEGFTFDNYLEILRLKPTGEGAGGVLYYNDEFIGVALPNTLLITFVTVPLSIIIALAIAIALNSIKVFQKIFQTIFFMPYVTNAIAIGMVFSVIFDNDGVFNFIFNSDINWLYAGNSGVAPNYWAGFFALCVYSIWHALPYKILIFLGGLQNVDKQYYDAAKVDGSSKWKTIRKVTIPLLSPQILYIMITSFIGAFKEYTSVVALFGADGGSFLESTGPSSMKTVAFYIYDQMANPNALQYAAAGAVVLLLIIMFFTLIQKQVSKKRVHY
jgi:ABC transporter, permease protein